MRCLYVLPHPKYFAQGGGGRVTHALGVIEGLRANGVSVTVVTGAASQHYRRQLDPFATVHEVPPRRFEGRLRWLIRLRYVVEDALRTGGLFDFGLMRYSRMAAPVLARVVRNDALCAWALEVNSLAFQDVSPKLRPLRLLVRKIESRSLRSAKLLYVVSKGTRDDLIEASGVAQERVVVIPNAAASWIWDAGATVEDLEAPRRTRFVYLGMLHGYYDFSTLIRAFRSITTAQSEHELHLFGHGPQRKRIMEFAADHPRIILHGHYHLQDLLSRGVLGPDCVAVLPYDLRPGGVERSPVKLYEYMALRLPVIAAKVGQLSSLVREGHTGFTYEPYDEASLARAMLAAASNCDGRQRMADKLWQEGREAHTWKQRMEVLLHRLDRSGSH